ncbi:MAG: DUF4159 domain-containing protein [Planctomycetes bacterium]|nr:DUF4159 domain-containing protein [Planctomycetota bacterium]
MACNRIVSKRRSAIAAALFAPTLVLVLAAAEPDSNSKPTMKKPSESSTSKPSVGDKKDAKSNGLSNQPGALPEPKQRGGETVSIVQVANLIYAGTKTSKCFSDHFLVEAEKASSISTSRRFHSVKLSSDEVFEFPLIIMTGEGSFQLTEQERDKFRKYVERGGFILASAGCSSAEWDQSFRSEIARVFPDIRLKAIDMSHPVFHTVHDIKELNGKHGKPRQLEGISVEGRIGVLYSQDGLNDTGHTQGCCCCGGDEITNAVRVNVNILAYTLVN